MDVKVSVVTTMYHSAPYLAEFYKRVTKAVRQITDRSYELIFVNDGSPDESASIVLDFQKHDSSVILIDLSRNFGHHQAILTGLRHVRGDFAFLLDCDLEEDPELLVEFWAVMENNDKADVIYGTQIRRKGNYVERSSGKLFYKLLNVLSSFEYPANTLTARLMRRNYVSAVLEFREKAVDVWALFVFAGFNQIAVPVNKTSKGTTTYTFARKFRMAIDIITSLSHRPLYYVFFLGIIWIAISAGYIITIFIKKWMYGAQIEGWASIMASLWLIGGIIIFLLGVIGIYLSKIFLEIKDRPLTIVKTIYRKQ